MQVDRKLRCCRHHYISTGVATVKTDDMTSSYLEIQLLNTIFLPARRDAGAGLCESNVSVCRSDTIND